MENLLTSRVPAAGAGTPLAAWLAARFRYFDEVAWVAEIAAGRLRCNGALATAAHRLAVGDRIDYQPPPAAAGAVQPPVPIVHHDPDFVVVDKPAHLVAHADGAFAQHTFLHALARDHNDGQPFHLVHRLDRETSGLLLLARNAEANALLQAQFPTGVVEKHYLAIVHGKVAVPTFTIEAAIGPALGSSVAARRGVRPSGTAKARPARTEVQLLEQFAAYALLRLTPRTGRTHQLRVHLEHCGHPLVGDKLYGRSDAEYGEYVQHLKAGGEPTWGHRLGAGRQLLHAAELALAHPRSGARLHLEAPLPADFATFLASARTR